MAKTTAPAEQTIQKVREALSAEPQTAAAIGREVSVGAATVRKALVTLAEQGVAVKHGQAWITTDLRVERPTTDQTEPTEHVGIVINKRSRIIHVAECRWVDKAPETYRPYTDDDADSLGANTVAANACRF